MRHVILLPLIIFAATSGAEAAGLQFVIDLPANAEQKVLRYQCEGQDMPFAVTYVNAAPNFLAIVPVEGKELVMAGVVTGSGAKYVAGHNGWQTKGTEAMLTDESAEPDAAPLLTCLEFNEIP